MRSYFSKLWQGIQRVGYFIPVTVYFLVFLAILIPGYSKLKQLSDLPESAYRDIFKVLMSLSLLFGISMVCFALLTTLFSFGYIKWQQRKGDMLVKLDVLSHHSNSSEQQVLSCAVNPLLPPFMGFIKLRVRYDITRYSPKFSPAFQKEKGKGSGWKGLFSWRLPEIREYHADKVILYVEDFFHFFSLAVSVPVNLRFHVHPVEHQSESVLASPRKTEETNVRIEELKRVEGEYLNYKNFESSDDVRRIVWKIYARNKELVVRTPERLDPYASHIYFYPSFYTFTSVTGNVVAEQVFLNYYKNACWTVYCQLAQKGFELTYIPDQSLPPVSVTDPAEKIKFRIAASTWQNETTLTDFVKAGYASVILISSLNSADEVEEWLERYGNDISFVFVPLSEAMYRGVLTQWMRWLFIKEDPSVKEQNATAWQLSPLRLKLKTNEDRIRSILNGSERVNIMTLEA